jgi:hypothetical protein
MNRYRTPDGSTVLLPSERNSEIGERLLANLVTEAVLKPAASAGTRSVEPYRERLRARERKLEQRWFKDQLARPDYYKRTGSFPYRERRPER